MWYELLRATVSDNYPGSTYLTTLRSAPVRDAHAANFYRYFPSYPSDLRTITCIRATRELQGAEFISKC